MLQKGLQLTLFHPVLQFMEIKLNHETVLLSQALNFNDNGVGHECTLMNPITTHSVYLKDVFDISGYIFSEKYVIH